MASRLVTATLSIDGVQGVITGFKQAGKAAVEYGSTAMKAGAQAGAWVDKHSRQLDSMGGSLLKMGAAGALALGGMAKAAIDWESAWAGVTKTVDGSPEQMAALEAGLRELAKTLPASHEEIAAVAEAAGQLGVHVDDVEDFTKTMIDLGETTNMSAEEAATTLQRFMNIMGTSTSDVDRLGSAIVGLGNNFATTEGEIAAMATRIAGIGAQMGLSEADVLALATAMSSVGIEAEAGGTAISMTMKRIDAAVREDGEALIGWAELAGMSADEFSTAWNTDAAGALSAVTEGLGEVIASGGSAAGVLEDLGVKGIRESDTMNRLALATQNAGAQQNMLRDALVMASDEWEKNTALAEEAEQRYQTTAAQMQMTLNSIKDEAITLGQAIMPMVESLLGFVNDLIGAFGNVPDGVKQWGLGVLGISTAAGLAAGSVLKLVVAASRFRGAIQGLGISMRAATLSMGAIGVALTAAGAALSFWMNRQAEAKARTEEMSSAIREQNGLYTEATRAMAFDQLNAEGLIDQAEKYGIAAATMVDAMLGIPEAQAEVNAATDAYMEKQRQRYAGSINAADGINEEAAATDRFRDGLTGLTGEFESAADAEQRRTEALEAGTDATESAEDAALQHAQAEQERAEALAAAEDATREALDAAQHYGNILLELSGSQIGVEKSIANLTETLKANTEEHGKNAGGLDLTTEAGRKNQEALDSLARSTMSYVETLAEQGYSSDEVTVKTQRARDEWIKAATAMGMAEDEAIDLANAYFGIPETVTTSFATPGAKLSQQEADTLNEKLRNIPDSVRSEIVAVADKHGLAAAERALANAARDRAVRLRATYVGASNAPVTGRVLPKADGGLVAGGGKRLTPMSPIAQMVPPDTWRVVGDRLDVDEAYIPLDGTSRSRRIWQEAGRRLGIRGYADGAVVTRQAQPVVQPVDSGPRVVINSQVFHPVAEPASVHEKHLLDRAAAIGTF